MNKHMPEAVRTEARTEILRYRDEGLAIQKVGGNMAKAKSRSELQADTTEIVFSGQGIIFAVIDDRESMREGKVTTIDVITEAIEAALDAGNEDSESIARYLTTSAFQHIADKRVRFNSVLKAGDVVGARISQKLFNSYNELAQMADDTEDPKEKASLRAEATGFAEALNMVISPFSCEDPDDGRQVNWDEVDRITAAFEKEQRAVRRERKGKIH